LKKAFTLLELVFVIVVIGILSAAIIPRAETNPVSEAVVNLVSDIRYAQHLAMVDDKYNATSGSNWYRDRWRIEFNTNKYTILSDTNSSAKNPINDGNEMRDIDLNSKYNISIALTGGCNGQSIISFDNQGRPMVGDLSDDTTAYVSGQLLTSTCVITLTQGSKSEVINIEPETGYIHRVGL